MRIWIDSDEAYPVFMFQDNDRLGGVEADVPAPQVRHWRKIQDEYDTMQRELQELAGGRL